MVRGCDERRCDCRGVTDTYRRFRGALAGHSAVELGSLVVKR